MPEQGFVFCSFNNNWKITPEVFDVWMRLLKAVDGSVLWLLRDKMRRGAEPAQRGAGARASIQRVWYFAGTNAARGSPGAPSAG